MKQLINRYGEPVISGDDDHFNALSKSIIYQQLSGKAAGTIYGRFLDLFQAKHPQPEEVVKIDLSVLRSIGLSKQKSNYINNLADYFANEGKDIDFDKLSDADVGEELIKIKGIGPWTIEMFLMFTLQREDILPFTDLGIRKGFKELFGLKELPGKEYMEKKSKLWKPYRTFACWYLWRIVDGDIVW